MQAVCHDQHTPVLYDTGYVVHQCAMLLRYTSRIRALALH